MTKRNQDINMFAGDTKDILVTMTTDLSGATIKWALKKRLNGTQYIYKTTSSGITVSGSTFTIRLDVADTSDLSGGYYHEAEVTDALGNVSTVMTGSAKIEPSGV